MRFLDARRGLRGVKRSREGTRGQSGVTIKDRADSSGATKRPLWPRPPGGNACPVELAVIDAPWGRRACALLSERQYDAHGAGDEGVPSLLQRQPMERR
jgi:hypothetical protein